MRKPLGTRKRPIGGPRVGQGGGLIRKCSAAISVLALRYHVVVDPVIWVIPVFVDASNAGDHLDVLSSSYQP